MKIFDISTSSKPKMVSYNIAFWAHVMGAICFLSIYCMNIVFILILCIVSLYVVQKMSLSKFNMLYMLSI